LCLESINKNSEQGTFNVNVIYTSSNSDFESGYEKLKQENIIQGIQWIQQTDFKNNVLQLLQTNADLSCFATDDDILYRKIDVDKIKNTLKEDQDVFCFSLRLGKNVKYCYSMNCNNVLIPLEEGSDLIKWDWTKHYADMGYPLSVDMHVFRTKDILKLTKQVTFKNPNEYEAALQIFESFPRFKMAAFENSSVVNSPTNIVQNTFQNRAGESFGISSKELNEKYLNGEIIDFDKIDFSNIVGCHQELKFEFKKCNL
jgi:hypothetical protein